MSCLAKVHDWQTPQTPSSGGAVHKTALSHFSDVVHQSQRDMTLLVPMRALTSFTAITSLRNTQSGDQAGSFISRTRTPPQTSQRARPPSSPPQSFPSALSSSIFAALSLRSSQANSVLILCEVSNTTGHIFRTVSCSHLQAFHIGELHRCRIFLQIS
jgi:hypothetical protein